MLRAVGHLQRVAEIERLLLHQVDVLETMTPLDFLDFRELLVPASGFQSVQFRLIENRLGVDPAGRPRIAGSVYTTRFTAEHRALIEQTEQQPSLFAEIEAWLERTPFLNLADYDFWREYCAAVERSLAADRRAIEEDPRLDADERERRLATFDRSTAHFAAAFDAEVYAEHDPGYRPHLSHRAFGAALLINLYRDEPVVQLPFRLLATLMDVDEGLTNWRYRHALMVRRMIGEPDGHRRHVRLRLSRRVGQARPRVHRPLQPVDVPAAARRHPTAARRRRAGDGVLPVGQGPDVVVRPTNSDALRRDADDPGYRDLFHIPPCDGWVIPERRLLRRQLARLCSPRPPPATCSDELAAWERLGVEGHFEADRPWFSYHELLTEPAARLVGAQPTEVVAMNSLTVNLHLLMVSFYRPDGERTQIVVEDTTFPSDSYAVRSQAAYHGLDPDEAVVRLGTDEVISYLGASRRLRRPRAARRRQLPHR